ncbi:MAG: septal ring lytic transglycosylase RlpA family protein [Ginsengibacter sp.]
MYKINYFNHAVFILIISALSILKFAGEPEIQHSKKPVVKYGIASYYAQKFNGKKTATGSIYNSKKISAACNVLPLRTWVKVTNLKNKKWIIVRINDRLHRRNKRLIDLSKAGAQKLGYIKSGITKVKVEVIKKPPGK